MVAPNPTATSLGWIRSISCEALRMAWRKSVECEMIRPSVPSSARFKMDLWRNRSYGYLPSKHWSWVYRKQKSMLIRIWMEKCFDAKKDEFRDFQIRWKRCWPQVEGTTVSWKKRLWSLIFALQFISLNLTQPPPPPKASWSILRPYILWIAWRSGPKNIKTKIKLPKQSPQTIKSATKKMATLRFLLPFPVRSFSLKSCCSSGYLERSLRKRSADNSQSDDWWTSNSSSDNIRRSLEKKERGFLVSIFAKGFKKQPMNVRNIIQDIIFSLQLIIFVLNLLDTLSIMICLKPNMKGIGL